MNFKLVLLLSVGFLSIISCSSNNRQKKIETEYVILNIAHQQLRPWNFGNQDNQALDSLRGLSGINSSNLKLVYDKALKARELTIKLFIHIDSLKALLISKTENINWKKADTISLIDIEDIEAKEKFDIPTQIMVNSAAAEDGSKGEAHKLRVMLNTYRKTMIGLLNNPADTMSVRIGILDKGGDDANQKYLNWEIYNFEEQPLASAIVTLTRIQNDIKNAEIGVIRDLLKNTKVTNS